MSKIVIDEIYAFYFFVKGNKNIKIIPILNSVEDKALLQLFWPKEDHDKLIKTVQNIKECLI